MLVILVVFVTVQTGFLGIDDWPHKSPQALTKCFVLTRILPPKTSQEVTHPRITPSQARLTWKFLRMSYQKGRCTFGDISIHHIPFKPFFSPVSMWAITMSLCCFLTS